MKLFFLLVAFIASIPSFAQSGKCEFSKSWKVDLTNVVATRVIKDESGNRISDTLDIERFKGKYSLLDSVIFNKGKSSLFFSNDGAIKIEEGSFKLSDKKFSFKAKGTSLASVKYSFKNDDASCMLVEEGINFTTIIKDDDQNYVWIRYYLIPKN